MPPRRRRRQTPCSAQTGMTKYALFLTSSFDLTFQGMTIKHLMYTRKVPFLYTEMACVLFFRFSDSPKIFFYVKRSVATISDQREYYFIKIFSIGDSSKFKATQETRLI